MRLCQAPLCVKHERACAATQVFVCVISASGMMQTPNLETVFSSCGGKWVRKGPPYLVQCKDSCESEEQRGQRRSRGWCDSRHCGRMFCICTVVSFSLLNGRSKRGLCNCQNMSHPMVQHLLRHQEQEQSRELIRCISSFSWDDRPPKSSQSFPLCYRWRTPLPCCGQGLALTRNRRAIHY